MRYLRCEGNAHYTHSLSPMGEMRMRRWQGAPDKGPGMAYREKQHKLSEMSYNKDV